MFLDILALNISPSKFLSNVQEKLLSRPLKGLKFLFLPIYLQSHSEVVSNYDIIRTPKKHISSRTTQ